MCYVCFETKNSYYESKNKVNVGGIMMTNLSTESIQSSEAKEGTIAGDEPIDR